MKKNYVIQMMNNENYHNYMMGAFFYQVRKEIVLATDPQEAVEIAKKKYPDYNINEGYVKTVEEIEIEEKERTKKIEQERKEQEEKERKTKEKKLQKELEKAQALGMTVEEYRKEQAKQRSIKRAENEIAKMKKEIEKLKREIAKKEKYIKEKRGE